MRREGGQQTRRLERSAAGSNWACPGERLVPPTPPDRRAKITGFKIVKRYPDPEIRSSKWVRRSDRPFCPGQVGARGNHLSREADKLTLIRRLSLDLIGLLPTAVEIVSFRTSNRMLTNIWWSACWPHLILASAGDGGPTQL